MTEDFYSHAPRGARPEQCIFWNLYSNISTHTPLAGRDAYSAAQHFIVGISTHTPLAGRDYLQLFSVLIP